MSGFMAGRIQTRKGLPDRLQATASNAYRAGLFIWIQPALPPAIRSVIRRNPIAQGLDRKRLSCSGWEPWKNVSSCHGTELRAPHYVYVRGKTGEFSAIEEKIIGRFRGGDC